ncbi:MAG TPA: ABC transporter substrate-binding protein [Anaerolineaceae bacterium]|nr:ABC transporter substrate-binding protein [Anaerolineaceae bacterium]
MRKLCSLVVLAALLLSSLAACAPAPTPAPTDEPAGQTEPQSPTEPAAVEEPTAAAEVVEPTAADDAASLAGQEIEIIGAWGGLEQEALMKVLKPFEEQTGVKFVYTGTRDVSLVLSRAQSGNPPDFYISPLPSVTTELAKKGILVALDSFMDMDALNQAYATDWLGLGSSEGHLYGIFGPVSIKSLVWYNPKVFAEKGYTIPTTWDEMLALTDQIAADGSTPWSIAMGSGDATGWVGTDWVEDIMLRTVGGEVYDQWVNHEIPWTDPRVKSAWETFGKIGLNEAYLFGGTSGELSVDFGDGADALYTDPANAYMHRQALFEYDYIRKHFPELKPGEDIDFFMLPPIDEQFGTPALSAGEMLIMFNDTPANRAFMNYWAGVDAQTEIAVAFGRLSANSQIPAEVYTDPLLGKAAELLANADAVRFDGSDLMPSAIGAGAFWKGMVDYVSGKDLDTVLQTIEDASLDAYKK